MSYAPSVCGYLMLAATAALSTSVNAQLTDPIPTPIGKSSITIELTPVASGLTAPNLGVSAGDGSNRLFVVDQPGYVRIIDNGVLLPTPFLDVSSRLVPLGFFGSRDENDFDERGLLGLAFHPDFAVAGSQGYGKLYTYSSETIDGAADFTVAFQAGAVANHQSVVAEWQIDMSNPNQVDMSSRRELLRVDEPQFNHNAGSLVFGHDDMLYVAFGDGGASNDNAAGHGFIGNGQDPSNVLGTILRIDVDGTNSHNGQYGIPGDNPFTADSRVANEVYAYGFRNPFRTSIDSETGELIAADVGQRWIEEIDVVTAGGNYGWRLKEGSFAFNFVDGSVSDVLDGLPDDLIDPVLEYDHGEGISVIGGFVYRGSDIPELFGKYVFGDFSTAFRSPLGRLFVGDLDTGVIEELTLGLDDRSLGLFVKGFGQDENGELYLMAGPNLGPFGSSGLVLRLSPSPVPVPAALWLFAGAAGVLLRRRQQSAVRG